MVKAFPKKGILNCVLIYAECITNYFETGSLEVMTTCYFEGGFLQYLAQADLYFLSVYAIKFLFSCSENFSGVDLFYVSSKYLLTGYIHAPLKYEIFSNAKVQNK